VTDPTLASGLRPGARFRCDGCGNVTRFDVVATTRTRRFHHFDLGGEGRVEQEDVLEQTIESVTCRWCGRADAIQVEPAPAAAG
jgi:transposase